MSVKIVSWNIMHSDWGLAERYAHCPPSVLTWSHRKPLIEAEMARRGADFYCLQECCHQDYPLLNGYRLLLAMNKKRQKSVDKGQNPQLCAIMYNKRWKLKSHCVSSRSLTATFTTESKDAESPELTIQCCHLPVNLSEHASHLKNLHADVVCGDFNNFPDSDTVALITKAGYSKSPRQPRTTYYRNNVIDYIFVRDSSPWRFSEALLWGTPAQLPSENWPSDHTWISQELIHAEQHLQ